MIILAIDPGWSGTGWAVTANQPTNKTAGTATAPINPTQNPMSAGRREGKMGTESIYKNTWMGEDHKKVRKMRNKILDMLRRLLRMRCETCRNAVPVEPIYRCREDIRPTEFVNADFYCCHWRPR